MNALAGMGPCTNLAFSKPACARAGVANLLLALLLSPLALAEKPEDLKPQGYVNDFAGALDAATKARISALCAEIDHKTKAQIAVVTIRTLDGVPVEDFANKLYQRWGIGPKSANQGVLILLATSDRRYRTEVGYGLEPILPDGKVGAFGREAVPQLRAGDYNGALLHVTWSIAQVIAADRGVTLENRLPEGESYRHKSVSGPGGIVILVVIFLVIWGLGAIGSSFTRPRRRRYGSGWWWMGPWIGGGGGWGGGSSWGGGGFSGGGGFGGFGGGSSGGGGASGSW